MDKCCDTEHEHNDHSRCPRCQKRVGFLNLGGPIPNSIYCDDHNELRKWFMNWSKKPVEEEITKSLIPSFPHNSFFD